MKLKQQPTFLRTSFFAGMLIVLAGLFSPKQANAAHITGAELVYECLSPGTYRVRLTLFRDCFGTGAQFDPTINLYAFDAATNATVAEFPINRPADTSRVNPPNWNACVGSTQPFCVSVAEYERIITLPPNPSGYYIAWARCCRNNTITNLAYPDCEGVTFLAHIPGTNVASCNSMPVFNSYPPLFLCAGQPFYFDHSATDADGDSLVYEISEPYTGTNTAGVGAGSNTGPCALTPSPVVGPTNPMGPAPYANVVFQPGFSYLNPFGSGSITIDPNTGFLIAQPNNPGIYVLAISVKEYRNGVLLSENKRDFQFHVVNCLPQGPPPTITHDLSGLTHSGDTIFISGQRPFCFDFTVNDPQTPSTIEVNPVSLAFGGNGGFPPPYATLNVNGNSAPVTGQICWESRCSMVGQTVELIITARDTSDCPNYNVIFDTVYVTITPPPVAPPVVRANISNVPVTSGDTIFADLQENFCFEFQVIDTLGGGNLASTVEIYDSTGTPLPVQPNFSTTLNGDTLNGSICFDTDCYFGNGYYFVMRGEDEYQCPPTNQNADTIWLNVRIPQNPTPAVSTDLLANPVSGDTIEGRVHDNFCFEFELVDTSGMADSLLFAYTIEDLNGNYNGPQPTFTIFQASADTVSGEVCWTPRCVNVDLLFRIIVTGTQVNFCNLQSFARDTVYIRVSEPFKPAPQLTHDTGPQFPGNTQINVEDNESFCFDFVMLDTVGPTYVSVETEVELLTGNPFTGTPPVVTFQTRTDSLIEGSVCWDIPCEYANQAFKIRLIGRDTFDCHSGNIIYDSVIVYHTENDPGLVDLCRVTVEQGDGAVLVEWQVSPETDVIAYEILRRREDELTFTVIDSVPATNTGSYLDSNVEPDNFVYCYAIHPLDRCGNTSVSEETACTVLLTGIPNNYTSDLAWTPYIGFSAGVSEYGLFRSFPHLNSGESQVTSVYPPLLVYSDADITEGQICYRVRALESGVGCGGESWSNEACVEFPPLVFMPNAFTPNGDGLNDFFAATGAFVDSYSLAIYDRWGKLIFQSRDLVNGWDGKINGQDVPEGVYMFQVEITGFDGSVLKQHGSVTLYR